MPNSVESLDSYYMKCSSQSLFQKVDYILKHTSSTCLDIQDNSNDSGPAPTATGVNYHVPKNVSNSSEGTLNYVDMSDPERNNNKEQAVSEFDRIYSIVSANVDTLYAEKPSEANNNCQYGETHEEDEVNKDYCENEKHLRTKRSNIYFRQTLGHGDDSLAIDKELDFNHIEEILNRNKRRLETIDGLNNRGLEDSRNLCADLARGFNSLSTMPVPPTMVYMSKTPPMPITPIGSDYSFTKSLEIAKQHVGFKRYKKVGDENKKLLAETARLNCELLKKKQEQRRLDDEFQRKLNQKKRLTEDIQKKMADKQKIVDDIQRKLEQKKQLFDEVKTPSLPQLKTPLNNKQTIKKHIERSVSIQTFESTASETETQTPPLVTNTPKNFPEGEFFTLVQHEDGSMSMGDTALKMTDQKVTQFFDACQQLNNSSMPPLPSGISGNILENTFNIKTKDSFMFSQQTVNAGRTTQYVHASVSSKFLLNESDTPEISNPGCLDNHVTHKTSETRQQISTMTEKVLTDSSHQECVDLQDIIKDDSITTQNDDLLNPSCELSAVSSDKIPESSPNTLPNTEDIIITNDSPSGTLRTQITDVQPIETKSSVRISNKNGICKITFETDPPGKGSKCRLVFQGPMPKCRIIRNGSTDVVVVKNSRPSLENSSSNGLPILEKGEMAKEMLRRQGCYSRKKPKKEILNDSSIRSIVHVLLPRYVTAFNGKLIRYRNVVYSLAKTLVLESIKILTSKSICSVPQLKQEFLQVLQSVQYVKLLVPNWSVVAPEDFRESMVLLIYMSTFTVVWGAFSIKQASCVTA